jgi:phosphoglycerate dehydrogenase-like enzyme
MNEDGDILILIETRDGDLAGIERVDPNRGIRVGPYLSEAEQALDPALMRGVEILLCEFPPANFDDFDRLRWIQVTSAGYGQVLDLPIIERGIRVTSGLGNFDVPIAEWNIMAMVMCHRHMLEMLENQRTAVWDRSARFQAELRGMVVGFYGYGGIARETARLAKAMGLTVWALTRNGTVRKRTNIYCVQGTGDPDGVLPDRVFGPDRKREFLTGVDVLVMALPLTPVTEGIVGEEELRMLKPSAILINPARAALIREDAFVRCLREKWIRGAALDVHYAYPLPPEHPLWSVPNLVLTPHISGSVASTHFLDRIYDIFAQNLQRYGAGRALLNELSASQLRGE